MALLSAKLVKGPNGSIAAELAADTLPSRTVAVQNSANATFSYSQFTHTECASTEIVETMVRYPEMFIFSVDKDGNLKWDLASTRAPAIAPISPIKELDPIAELNSGH